MPGDHTPTVSRSTWVRGWPVSLRARLALWYALACGACTVAIAFTAYLVLARVTRDDADRFLADTAGSIVLALEQALNARSSGVTGRDELERNASQRVLATYRFRDIGVAVFRANQTSAQKPTLQLMAVDTISAASRAFGGEAGWRRASATATRALASQDTAVVTLDPHRERVLAMPARTRHGVFVVAVSQSIETHEVMLRRTRQALALGLPFALLLATAGGYALARASLQSVDAMREQAERIGASTLYARLPTTSPDEIGRLAKTFNALLDRVEEAFDQRRRFTADASHELRTPVAVIRGESALALAAEDRTGEEYRSSMRLILGEAGRLTHIVDDLFLLARQEASEQPLQLASLFLEEVVGDCVDAIGPIASARQIAVQWTPESEVPCRGDDRLLRRCVMNLLDNAMKYTPEGGTVAVSAEPLRAGGARVCVRDTGPGIPVEERSRVFERFYRIADDAHRGGIADASGAGLGLPIARWIAEAHGGTLTYESNVPHGSAFVLMFPPTRSSDQPTAFV